MDRKRLPIGISDYKEVISDDYYYVDKTDFIRRMVEEGSKITLLPRPRDLTKRGVIMELKVYDADYDESPEAILASALQQIEDKQYAATLHAAGVTHILKMAITFDGKKVWTKSVESRSLS